MWRWDMDHGREAPKIRWEIVQYTRGRGLDLGAGDAKAFPHFTSVDNGDHARFGFRQTQDIRVDTCEVLDLFADLSMDFIFSSHLLEHIDDYAAALKEWWRVIKPGGHLVLYLPHRDLYPNVKDDGEIARAMARKKERLGRDLIQLEEHEVTELVVANRKAKGVENVGALYAGSNHANSDHKHDFVPDDIIAAMRAIDGWDLIENQVRDEGDEYSFFMVWQKLPAIPAAFETPGEHWHCGHEHTDYAEKYGARQLESWKNPKPTKTVCVCRYGAYGDVIMASSVCAALKAQGYHVTFMGSPPGVNAISADPNIDAWYLQDKDQVPNAELGHYWAYWEKRFDKWVQLSGSVEDTLLATPGRPNHAWPHALRHRMLNQNYVEFAHEIAEVPYVLRQQFYPTPDEVQWAKSERATMGDFLVIWSLAGSSLHKTWDGLDQIVARIMVSYPNAHVALVGGPECAILESGWENEKRVHRTCGKWSIRQTMSMTHQADLIIGPETGVLNSAALLESPKIVFLSHSSVENLTRDWTNTTSLYSKTTACYPCHRLHMNNDGWDKFCPRTDKLDEEGGRRGVAHCQAEITNESVWNVVRGIMDAHYEKSEAA